MWDQHIGQRIERIDQPQPGPVVGGFRVGRRRCLQVLDTRRDPLVVRKATLASVLAKTAVGIRFNEHMEFDDGEVVFYHACRLGLEGIVRKRKDSTYRSGRSPDWLKMKNPACEAVRREAEEDWSNK